MITTTTAPMSNAYPNSGSVPRRGGRAGIALVLIVSIVLAGFARDWARSLRSSPAERAAGDGAGASLANMNSFSLALLLGGLRGPLVMFLWTSSENLKNEKNLEGFDTYVEWIRLLQPEFDSVLIFQVWNKAYNISVQMASNANKYTTILDAMDFARKAELQRPNNVSMVYQIGSLFFDKLGGAAEKAYYKRRVREESRPHTTRQKIAKDTPGWRRLELDPVLDSKGMVLPELLKPRFPRPADLPAGSEWNDGSELQYLASYQPFPYGVGAMAFGYNYHKRAQVLQERTQQVHANLSPMVVDSRPALALKGWAEDEWERGRRLEAKALNAVLPETEPRDREPVTANVAVDAPLTDASVLAEAIDSYDLASRLSRDALVEYERHLRSYPDRLGPYQSHIDSMRAQGPLLAGDRDYLKAMQAARSERKALLASAAEHYREAVRMNVAVVFRYYVSDEIAHAIFPVGVSRGDLSKLPADQYVPAYEKALTLIAQQPFDAEGEDRQDYQRALERAQVRLKLIGS
ncbi:MAG: hypothetical protein ABIP55_02200 [Tepidisphaeraceae bacterium]